MIVRSVIYALFAVGILALAIPKYAISQSRSGKFLSRMNQM